MIEEFLVRGAQVIQAGLAIRGANESVLRAFAVAQEAYFAFAAIAGQGIGLGAAEIPLEI